MKYKTALEDVYKEIEVMKKLDSECVVRLHEVIDAPDSNSLCMVIDFCTRGDVSNWQVETEVYKPCIDSITEKVARTGEFFSEVQIQAIIRDIVVGLDFCH